MSCLSLMFGRHNLGYLRETSMEHIAIIGAGTMGHALAAVFAMGGHSVSLYDVDDSALEAAPARIQNIFHTINQAMASNAS